MDTNKTLTTSTQDSAQSPHLMFTNSEGTISDGTALLNVWSHLLSGSKLLWKGPHFEEMQVFREKVTDASEDCVYKINQTKG